MGVEVHVEGDVGRRPDGAVVRAEQPCRRRAELTEHRACHRQRLPQGVHRRFCPERREQGVAGGVPAQAAPGADEHELAQPPCARAGPRGRAELSRRDDEAPEQADIEDDGATTLLGPRRGHRHYSLMRQLTCLHLRPRRRRRPRVGR